MKHSLTTLVSVALLAGAASAQVVASDNFSYVGLLTANGWSNHSGTGFFLNANGSYAELLQGAGSREDANLPFAAFGATDTIFASFTLNVPSGGPVNPDAQGLYCVHFKDSGTSFRGRTGVLSPAAGGDYQLAINADSSDLGLGAVWPVDLAFDTNYAVVINWNAATGASQLWLNPYAETSPSIAHTGTATGTIIEQFALRQSNDYTGSIYIDDVVVGNTFADVACASLNSISRLDVPACATATLDVTGTVLPGNDITATITGGTIPLLVASFTSLGLDLTPFLGCGCVLIPNLDVQLLGSVAVIPVTGLPLGVPVFVQGADITLSPGASSPCDLGGLYLGLTNAFCFIPG